jgi:hypothetical protein
MDYIRKNGSTEILQVNKGTSVDIVFTWDTSATIRIYKGDSTTCFLEMNVTNLSEPINNND